MAAELSPRAWHCISQFIPSDSFYGVDVLSSYFHRNYCDDGEDWHLDPAYFDSEGFRIQSGVYSLADSVNAIFSPGPPIMLVDTRWMPAPRTLIHAVVERFKAVASGPHHFRPVQAYYRWQGSRYTSTLEGMYQSFFPCWRCDAAFDVPHRCYSGETVTARVHSMRFHLAAVGGLYLTLELNIAPNHGPYCCQDDLAVFIFEHDAPICRVPIAGHMPVAGRQALQNPEVRQEAFKFLSRFELDTVQQCSRRWYDFVDTTANSMALYRIQFALDMKDEAHVEMWNRSATGVLPRHRRFDLCDEPATMIHDLLRNSVSSVIFHAHGPDSWSCLLWIVGGATNFSVDHLSVSASTTIAPLEVNMQSLQETVDMGRVRSLHFQFISLRHPLDHTLIVACASVRGISDLSLQIIAQSVDDLTWIAELMSTSKLSAISICVRFWHDQTVFNGTFDLRKLPSAIAQIFIDNVSFENLPHAFVVDVSGISSLFEAPAREPSFKGLLNLSYAPRRPRTLEFETTAFHLRNARSGDDFTVLIGRGTQWNSGEQTLRVFKGQQRFTNDTN